MFPARVVSTTSIAKLCFATRAGHVVTSRDLLDDNATVDTLFPALLLHQIIEYLLFLVLLDLSACFIYEQEKKKGEKSVV